MYEEALPIYREVGHRAGEAATLNNMGLVYDATGRPSEALAMYEEALPIRREVGDRAGEAATLNNIGMVYWATGRPSEALALYEQALPIRREVGDRAGEATTLNNMAGVYYATGRGPEALALYEEALPIYREVGDRAGEADTLWKLARLLGEIGRTDEAIDRVQQGIELFHQGLTHDAANDTVVVYEDLLQKLQAGEPISGPGQGMPADELQGALLDFVNAPDWDASRQVLETQQELLLSDDADAFLADLLLQLSEQDNQELAAVLQRHKDLLLRCRAIGIEKAFAELQPD